MSQIVLYADPIQFKEEKIKYFDITKEGWIDDLESVLTLRDQIYVTRQDLNDVRDLLEENGNKYIYHIMNPSSIYIGEKRPYGLDIIRAAFIDIKENVMKELAPYDSKRPVYVQDGYDELGDKIIKKYPEREVKKYGRMEIEGTAELKDRERFTGTSFEFQTFVIEKLEKPMGMKFRPHQIKVAYAMVRGDPNIRGMLAAHPVGTGKTLTSLLAAICTRALRPDLDIKIIEIIVKPVIENQWNKEIKRFPLVYQKDILTFKVDSFYNELKVGRKATASGVKDALDGYCKDKFLIIDEAHELRTELPMAYKMGDTGLYNPENLTKYLTDKKTKGKKALMYIACSHLAKKVLLLTGTLVVNEATDVVNLFNMILPPSRPITDKEIEAAIYGGGDTFQIAEKLRSKLGGLVSVVNKDTALYPTTLEKNVWIDMSPEYLDAYLQIERDERDRLNIPKGAMASGAFYSNVRQASNKIDQFSPKVDVCIRLITEHTSSRDPLRRVVIYSPYREYGIKTVQDNLDELKVEYRQITGDESGDMKQMELTKDWYNSNDLSKPKILFITEAGSVGLDLKRTSAVILLQPNWNEAKDEQIIGRAVRSGSHADVEKKEVSVYHLFLKKPYEIVDQAASSVSSDFIRTEKKVSEQADAELMALMSQGIEIPPIVDKTASADYRLFTITQEKAQSSKDFIEVLRVLSI